MFGTVALQRECFAEILLFAGIGMLFGFGGLRLFAYATAQRIDSVEAARYYADRPEARSPSSHFPRGIFFAIVFGAIPLVKGWCPGFLGRHPLFAAGGLFCAISTAAWLIVAFLFRQSLESQRRARIEEFMADSSAAVPAPVGLNILPLWLRVWSWGNTTVLLLLVAVLLRGVLVLPPA
jgi:hypothetical protein